MSDVIHHDGFKRYSSGFGAENEGFGMEVTMLAIMIMGYIGRYFITISAYVLADGIREDLGMREGEYENLVSTGFVFELIGTLVAGIVADRVDPRLTYLVSQYLVVLSALLLAWSQTLWQFQLGWYFIALIQCGTWGSTVKIVSKWTPFERQGRSMAAASFSFLFGDLIARTGVGIMIAQQLSWRACFQACSLVAAVSNVPALVMLRSSPADYGLSARRTISREQDNLLAGSSQEPTVWECFKAFMSSTKFLLVLLANWVSCGHREFWLTHTAVYFEDILCHTQEPSHECREKEQSNAAFCSAAFSLIGAISSWTAGTLKDSCGIPRRGVVLSVLACVYMMVLIQMWAQPPSQYSFALINMNMLAFSLYLIYNYLTSFALDFGGERASSTANGIVLSTGFLGAISFSVAHRFAPEWNDTFGIHSMSTMMLIIASIALWHLDQNDYQMVTMWQGTKYSKLPDLEGDLDSLIDEGMTDDL